MVLLAYFTQSLLGVFNFIVLLSVLTTLLPHLVSMGAELVLARRHAPRESREWRRAHVVVPVAFLFVLYTMYGVGWSVLGWGLLAVAAGLPVYAYLKGSWRLAVGSWPFRRQR